MTDQAHNARGPIRAPWFAVGGFGHPGFAVDRPNEPHIDDDGMCTCTAECCCHPVTDLCSCPSCGGAESGCPDHA